MTEVAQHTMHTHMYPYLSVSSPVEIYFKKLTDIIMEASKSRICEVGGQAVWRPREERIFQLESRGHLQAELFLRGGQSFSS